MFFSIALPLIVIAANVWTYRIYQTSILMLLLLVAQTITLFVILIKKHIKILYAPLFVLFVLYSLVQFKEFTLSTIIKVDSSPEVMEIELRQPYYRTELNWVYWNRYGKRYFDDIKPIFDKYTIRLYSGLDLTRYFGDYRIIFFPLFVLGLISLLKTSNRFMLIFFLLSFLAQGLFQIREGTGYVYYYPIINATVAYGIYKILKR